MNERARKIARQHTPLQSTTPTHIHLVKPCLDLKSLYATIVNRLSVLALSLKLNLLPRDYDAVCLDKRQSNTLNKATAIDHKQLVPHGYKNEVGQI